MLIARWRNLIECLPAGVKLLAVSKGYSANSIRELADFGQRDFGESRIQEALPKIESLKDLKKLRWHFIGRLQSNKIRKVVRRFEVIHSVDSLRLAQSISRIAGEEKKLPKAMLQIKLREDPNKSGFSPENLKTFYKEIFSLPNIKFIGLMTMAPKNLDLKNRRNLFLECRDLADQLGLKDCSMGMSQDWEEALEAGATWIRVGSLLFNPCVAQNNCAQDITKND